jgi:hypothetical protein
MCYQFDETVSKSYENRVSSREFLDALTHRLIHLRGYCDSLQALAEAGEQKLEVDRASQRPKLSPYPMRASIIVMICASIEGILMDLGNETKRGEGFTLAPNDLRGSSLEKASNFFKKVALLRFPDQTQTWSKLKALFELRNALVHAWGQVADRSKRKVASLQGVVVSETGEANLDAVGVGEALRIMRDFADELEAYLGGPQDRASGT